MMREVKKVKSKMLILVFIVMLLSFVSIVVFASHPLTTDDAGVLGTGNYELEVGYNNAFSDTDIRNITSGVSLKHGITDKLDLGLSFPYQVDPVSNERFGEAALSLKFSLIKDLLAISYTNECGESSYALNGIFTYEIKPFTTHYNLGYLQSGDKTVNGITSYSAAIEYPLEKIDFVAEVLGKDDGSSQSGFVDWLIGVRYKLNEKNIVSAGLGKSFKDVSNNVVLGYHLNF